MVFTAQIHDFSGCRRIGGVSGRKMIKIGPLTVFCINIKRTEIHSCGVEKPDDPSVYVSGPFGICHDNRPDDTGFSLRRERLQEVF